MPKAFSDQEKEAIREQFRAKGKKLFEKHGLKKISVDELTEAVGVSKGAFYLFYDSKEELFLEVLEQIEKEIQTSILDFAIKPKSNARQNLKGLLKNFLVTWDDYPLLKDFSKSDFDYLVRKIPAERALKHANSDTEFTNELVKKIKREGIAVTASPRQINSLIKSLFFIGLHREDLGEDGYEESMDVLTDLVSGYIVGE
ncbi:MAG TPA: TetR/AcrR family transcriptional regulator [Anaerolineales bacterium]|nr:TetR/AcrR family transcriptional regulator [Anaerolineales bacterium]